MGNTNSSRTPPPPQKKVTEILRLVMIGEIEAINGYQAHILNSSMSELNQTWLHIMLDEKRHYAMTIELLRKYDPVELKYFLEPHELSNHKNHMQQYRPSYDKQIILNNIREDIKGELIAINAYEEYITYIQQKDVKDALQIIIDDEKEHTEHLTQVLLKYDPDPYKLT